jgi:hypothetical protein
MVHSSRLVYCTGPNCSEQAQLEIAADGSEWERCSSAGLPLHPQSNASLRQDIASLGELSDLRGPPTLIQKKAFTVSG